MAVVRASRQRRQEEALPLRSPDGSEPPLTVPLVESGNVWAAVGVARGRLDRGCMRQTNARFDVLVQCTVALAPTPVKRPCTRGKIDVNLALPKTCRCGLTSASNSVPAYRLGSASISS